MLVRAIRYAVERRRAETSLLRLREEQLVAAESSRLERGLLPSPLLAGSPVRAHTFYRSGRTRAVIGGDFFDAVLGPDGTVHAIVGDVCGHGPDEAALGALLRVSWRALVLAGVDEPQLLPKLQQVLVSERHDAVAVHHRRHGRAERDGRRLGRAPRTRPARRPPAAAGARRGAVHGRPAGRAAAGHPAGRELGPRRGHPPARLGDAAAHRRPHRGPGCRSRRTALDRRTDRRAGRRTRHATWTRLPERLVERAEQLNGERCWTTSRSCCSRTTPPRRTPRPPTWPWPRGSRHDHHRASLDPVDGIDPGRPPSPHGDAEAPVPARRRRSDPPPDVRRRREPHRAAPRRRDHRGRGLARAADRGARDAARRHRSCGPREPEPRGRPAQPGDGHPRLRPDPQCRLPHPLPRGSRGRGGCRSRCSGTTSRAGRKQVRSTMSSGPSRPGAAATPSPWSRPPTARWRRTRPSARSLFDATRAPLGRLAAVLDAERLAARDGLNSAADALRWVGIAIAVAVAAFLAAAAWGLRRGSSSPSRPLRTRCAPWCRATCTGRFEAAARRRSSSSARTSTRCGVHISHEVDLLQEANRRLDEQAQRAGAVQPRPRAVRLRRLARPAGAAAQGRQLLPAAAAPVRRAARRAGRPVHRVRGRRREAHAAPDQRPAGLLPGRPHHVRLRGRSTSTRSRWPPRPSSRRRAPTLDGEIVVGDLPQVHGDAALLRQLLLNLIGNALKFRRPGTAAGGAHRRRERDGDAGSSRVADNGIGIEPEFADKIFVIFQRLHGARRLRGHRHRPGDGQEDRRVPRRPDLARHRPPRGTRHRHPVHSPGGRPPDRPLEEDQS